MFVIDFAAVQVLSATFARRSGEGAREQYVLRAACFTSNPIVGLRLHVRQPDLCFSRVPAACVLQLDSHVGGRI